MNKKKQQKNKKTTTDNIPNLAFVKAILVIVYKSIVLAFESRLPILACFTLRRFSKQCRKYGFSINI